MARIIVVGGSMAGLGASLLLARDGHEVVVLEQDAAPLPQSPVEAFEKWDRHGAPQVRHSHAFLARLRNLLRDELPDVLERLLDAGAEELRFLDLLPPTLSDRTERPGDDDLIMLGCRRLTFEFVLRRVAEETPNLDFRDGTSVTGLLHGDAPTNAAPCVTGVELSDGERLTADLVVDATGRRSRLRRWIEELGAPRPREDAEDSGIFYCSRFYRLLPGAPAPQRDTNIGADLGYLKYGIFHGDGDIFSITFAASPEDAPLRALLKVDPFEAAAAACTATAPWRRDAVSEPISPVHGMARLLNTRRYFVEDGEPVALGVVAIGDASIHTNPLYGRGCSFALVHGQLLALALREHPDDPRAMALALDAATTREIVPWYEMTLQQDRDARETAARIARGEKPDAAPEGPDGVVDPKAYMRSLIRHGLVPAMRTDPDVARAFFRSFNLLTPPSDVMRDPAIFGKVLEAYQQRESRQEPVQGPDREAMIQLLRAA